MSRISYLIILLAVISCGIDPNAVSTETQDQSSSLQKTEIEPAVEQQQSFLVGKKKSLPECDEDNEASLAYVQDEKVFYGCSSGKWAEVEIKGEKGEKGEDGEDGKDGIDGKDGLAGKDGVNGADGEDAKDAQGSKIETSIFCQAKTTMSEMNAKNLLSGENGMHFTYQAVITSAGDVFVSATIDHGSSQASQTLFYSSKQMGAEQGTITLTSDWYAPVTNSGWWTFSVNKKSMVLSIVYTDESLPGASTRTFNFTNACKASSF